MSKVIEQSVSAMSHLRERRASLTCVEGSRVKVASVTWHVARRVMARRADTRLVFRIERAPLYSMRL